MRISTYLTASRHGLYYFRFPIPSALHPHRRQSDIRLSLGIRCPREALHLARALGYVGERLLQQPGIQHMEYQAIRDVLHEHFKHRLEQRKQHIAQQGRLEHIERVGLQNSHDIAADALAHHDYSLMGTDAQLGALVDTYELPIKPSSKAYGTLRTEFLKAFRDYCSTMLSYDAKHEHYDFTGGIAAPVANQPKAKKLAVAIDEYCDDKLRLKQWREHVAKDYRSQFNLLLEYLGKDVSLHLSPEVATDVKAMLVRLPKNRNKGKLKHLSLPEQLQVADAKRITPVTANKHLITYSALYDWVIKRKQTTDNPFRLLIDNVKKTHLEREEFTKEQIRQILAAAMDARATHHKWGVLIGFYTGARVNEIAQLYGKDIVQEDGVWCFRFSDDESEQRLKNDASRRIVPIHSRLIELGFLDLAAKAGDGRIFHKLSYEKKHGYGRGISRWFNTSLLPKLGMKSDVLMYHCIRHTVAQQLRNNKVQEATLKDILGHTHGDVTMGTYANNLDKRVMQEAIETLRYA